MSFMITNCHQNKLVLFQRWYICLKYLSDRPIISLLCIKLGQWSNG
uniref:Uncharacterized protein n=1 Tax=Arundo donax TaxID=35708 RepID=A0A0A9ENC1_ARUDO